MINIIIVRKKKRRDLLVVSKQAGTHTETQHRKSKNKFHFCFSILCKHMKHTDTEHSIKIIIPFLLPYILNQYFLLSFPRFFNFFCL